MTWRHRNKIEIKTTKMKTEKKLTECQYDEQIEAVKLCLIGVLEGK